MTGGQLRHGDFWEKYTSHPPSGRTTQTQMFTSWNVLNGRGNAPASLMLRTRKGTDPTKASASKVSAVRPDGSSTWKVGRPQGHVPRVRALCCRANMARCTATPAARRPAERHWEDMASSAAAPAAQAVRASRSMLSASMFEIMLPTVRSGQRSGNQDRTDQGLLRPGTARTRRLQVGKLSGDQSGDSRATQRARSSWRV